MSKGPTKAQQALTEAREWIEAAKEEVTECEAALVRAQGQLAMHETIYAVLEKTLTRQSPQKSSKKSSSKSRKKSTAECVSCLRCGAPWNDSVHVDRKLPAYHLCEPSSTSSAKGAKSKRGESLSSVIQRTPKVKISNADDGSDPLRLPQYCLTMVDDNGGEIACGKTADDNIHHLSTHPDYHEFDMGKSLASTVGRSSSANGVTEATTRNSGTQPEDVSPVAREASGGE